MRTKSIQLVPRSAFRSPRSGERGGILVVTIIFCALVGLVLVAYLSMLHSQNKFTHRSQVWNDCMPLCEAGIEEALAHLNYSGTLDNFAINGWTFTGGAYRKESFINGGTVRMAIDTSMPPTVLVQGLMRAPINTNYLTRTIRLRTRLNYRFPHAILSKGSIACNSAGARLDSFDSTDPLKSTLGQYDPLKAGDQAMIATTDSTATAIDIGNLSVYGYCGTGPGGKVVISPNGNVGDTLFNTNPLNDGKIQAGHFRDDVNVYIPDMTLPSNFMGVPPQQNVIIGGVTYAYVLGSGDYSMASLNLAAGARMLVTGNARLHVSGNTTVGGTGNIDIRSGAHLDFYSGGIADIKGNVNNPGLAKDFSLIGLKTCTAINYTGGAAFVGTVYAPQASVYISGGSGLYGAVVAGKCTVTGGMSVHYDEALKGNPREGRFIAAAWQEL